jgi:phosphocarrier protein
MKAKEFVSDITILNLSSPTPQKINAKAIMKILAASISSGDRVEITAEGEDEQQAVEALVSLFEAGFSEEPV